VKINTYLCAVRERVDELGSLTLNIVAICPSGLLCRPIYSDLDVLNAAVELHIVVPRECVEADRELFRSPFLVE
jgi:hypothetical protein